MTLEENDIIKIHDKVNHRDLYISVVKVNYETAKVKLLSQPSYELTTKKYADDIFLQFCRYDDEVFEQPLNFNKDRLTFEISEYMWRPLERDELIKLLKHLVYIASDDSMKSVILNGIEKLRYL